MQAAVRGRQPRNGQEAATAGGPPCCAPLLGDKFFIDPGLYPVLSKESMERQAWWEPRLRQPRPGDFLYATSFLSGEGCRVPEPGLISYVWHWSGSRSSIRCVRHLGNKMARRPRQEGGEAAHRAAVLLCSKESKLNPKHPWSHQERSLWA